MSMILSKGAQFFKDSYWYIRSTKSETLNNDKKSQFVNYQNIGNSRPFFDISVIWYLNLFRVSIFEFRILHLIACVRV